MDAVSLRHTATTMDKYKQYLATNVLNESQIVRVLPNLKTCVLRTVVDQLPPIEQSAESAYSSGEAVGSSHAVNRACTDMSCQNAVRVPPETKREEAAICARNLPPHRHHAS
jgi:hypothetical protein